MTRILIAALVFLTVILLAWSIRPCRHIDGFTRPNPDIEEAGQ